MAAEPRSNPLTWLSKAMAERDPLNSPANVTAPGPGGPSRRWHAYVWDALDGDPTTAPAARWIELFLQLLIIANVLAVILETVPGMSQQAGRWFQSFEALSIAVFTMEYFARLWSSPGAGRYGNTPIRARLTFAVTPMALIDLAVILPFYLSGVGLDLRVLRAVRLLRLFRVAKLVRYVRAVRVIGRVVHAKREQLTVVAVALLLLLVISASLVYAVEHEAQPERFASILDAMWRAAATLTTVGYGDVYPQTPLGKLLGALIALGGIAFFALPAGSLGAGFLEVFQGVLQQNPDGAAAGEPRTISALTHCPHCGGHLALSDLPG
jgi:voltage-gated potassium channel